MSIYGPITVYKMSGTLFLRMTRLPKKDAPGFFPEPQYVLFNGPFRNAADDLPLQRKVILTPIAWPHVEKDRTT